MKQTSTESYLIIDKDEFMSKYQILITFDSLSHFPYNRPLLVTKPRDVAVPGTTTLFLDFLVLSPRISFTFPLGLFKKDEESKRIPVRSYILFINV